MVREKEACFLFGTHIVSHRNQCNTINREQHCVFQEMEYMKRLARRCYVYVKPEKVRWLTPGKLQVNTNGTVWIKIEIEQIRNMILQQLDKVESIFKKIGIEIITSRQMETVIDSDNVPIGHGLWTLNQGLRTPFLQLLSAEEFIECDNRIGIALAFACSYSGGGAMRIPEVNEISLTRLTAGSVRRCALLPCNNTILLIHLLASAFTRVRSEDDVP